MTKSKAEDKKFKKQFFESFSIYYSTLTYTETVL